MEQLKEDFQTLEKLLDKYNVDTTHNLRLDIQAGFRQFGDGITDASSLQTIQSKYNSLLQSFEEHVGKYLHYLASNQSSDNLQKIRTICTDFSDRKNVLNYELNGKTPIEVAMNSGFISAVTLLNKSLGVKPILKSSTTKEDDDLYRHGHVTLEDLEGSKKIEKDMRNQFLLEYYRKFKNKHKMNPTKREMNEYMKHFSPNDLLIHTAANTSNAASREQILQETRKQDTNPLSDNPSDKASTRVRFAQGGRKKKPSGFGSRYQGLSRDWRS